MRRVGLTALSAAALLCASRACADPRETALQLALPPSLSEALLNLVRVRIDERWHEGAYARIPALFRLLTRLDPEDLDAWATGGWFLMDALAPASPPARREALRAAGMDFLKEGLERNPGGYRMYWELATVHYRRGEYAEALGYLDRAVRFEHPFTAASLRAHCLRRLGRREEALSQWREIAERFPEARSAAERNMERLDVP